MPSTYLNKSMAALMLTASCVSNTFADSLGNEHFSDVLNPHVTLRETAVSIRAFQIFAQHFIPEGVTPREKEQIETELRRIPESEREEFTKAFLPITKSRMTSFWAEPVVEALIDVREHGWKWSEFAQFLVEVQKRSDLSKDSSGIHSDKFGRIVINLAHKISKDHDQAFLSFVSRHVKAEYSVTDKSWMIAGLSKVSPENYNNVTSMLGRLDLRGATGYDISLFFPYLNTVDPSDTAVIAQSQSFFLPGLSYEHRSSIIGALAKINREDREGFINRVNQLSEGKDMNYRAWLIQALARVPHKWHEEASQILQNNQIECYDLPAKMNAFVRAKNKL